VPVIKLLFTSISTASAMSSVALILFRRCKPERQLASFIPCFACKGVSIMPVAMVETRILSSPNSDASYSVKLCRAALLAIDTETGNPAMACSNKLVPIFTMLPPPRFSSQERRLARQNRRL